MDRFLDKIASTETDLQTGAETGAEAPSAQVLASQMPMPQDALPACGRFAAIDIGTVTCRLLIADVTPDGGLCEVRRELAYTNLGLGVSASGRLASDAIGRVVDVVRCYLGIIADCTDACRPLCGLSAIATSAARDAANAEELIQALAALGVGLSVIEGTTEARLSFTGASSPFPGENIGVFDIGGGSTEIILGTSGEHPKTTHSFNIGCRRVSEKFFTDDPPSALEIADARRWILDSMQGFFTRSVLPYAPKRYVGVAGTATSVVSIRDKMQTYDPDRVHMAEVGRVDLDAVFEQLSALTCAERKHVTGLAPERADVIVAGLLILGSILDLAHCDRFTVSEADILHGIVIALSRAANPS